jgi:hypothetical protein
MSWCGQCSFGLKCVTRRVVVEPVAVTLPVCPVRDFNKTINCAKRRVNACLHSSNHLCLFESLCVRVCLHAVSQ